MKTNKKEAIKRAIAISIMILLITVVGFIMIKYEIEGEANMPFQLTKIMMISTADGIEKDEKTMSITQCNDLYFYIEKNEQYTQKSMIESVSIENIKIMSTPVKGKVRFYRPNNTEGLIYQATEDFLLEDSITYTGDSQTDLKNLTISNQGGIIGFRSCLQEVGEIAIDTENPEKAVGYNNDGTLLQKAGIAISDIRYNIGFDMIIELTDGKMYKGYVNITMPLEEVNTQGVQGAENIDTENIVFKRIKIR